MGVPLFLASLLLFRFLLCFFIKPPPLRANFCSGFAPEESGLGAPEIVFVDRALFCFLSPVFEVCFLVVS